VRSVQKKLRVAFLIDDFRLAEPPLELRRVSAACPFAARIARLIFGTGVMHVVFPAAA
jgi:hypothetical protein